jgi:hypothetical protein
VPEAFLSIESIAEQEADKLKDYFFKQFWRSVRSGKKNDIIYGKRRRKRDISI